MRRTTMWWASVERKTGMDSRSSKAEAAARLNMQELDVGKRERGGK